MTIRELLNLDDPIVHSQIVLLFLYFLFKLFFKKIKNVKIFIKFLILSGII